VKERRATYESDGSFYFPLYHYRILRGLSGLHSSRFSPRLRRRMQFRLWDAVQLQVRADWCLAEAGSVRRCMFGDMYVCMYVCTYLTDGMD
jgi:hypothetical protein